MADTDANVCFEWIADTQCEWPQHEGPGQRVAVAGKLHPRGQHRPCVGVGRGGGTAPLAPHVCF